MNKFLLAILLFIIAFSAAAIRLQQGAESFIIDPATLQIQVGDTQVNAPQSVQTFTALQTTASTASWYWPAQRLHINADVQGADLRLAFRSDQPQILNWFSLPTATRALLLPLGEGSRIPLDNPEWLRYLTHEQRSIDTNYDLKLPLWSQQQDKIYSWLLLTPFHNRITFQQHTSQLAMYSQHEFNRFNQQQPFEVLLHVGDSPLSGALRYRAWLKQTGQFSTLREKLVVAPEGRKLIGATFLYLWGSQLLAPEDVRDWPGLVSFLKSPAGAVVKRNMGAEAQKILQQSLPQDWQKPGFITAINRALVAQVPLNATPDEPHYLRAQQQQAAKVRQLTQQQLGTYLTAPHLWGQGLSETVIDSLHRAGLARLWLGTDTWTAAFLHPDAVERAKAAGYLVASYDSYDTAVPPGRNDSWITAQLPAALRERCAIVRADGSKKPGFGGEGYYMNPGCVLPYSQQRMRALMQLAGLNSLFLDVDGTGMVDDDYQPAHLTSATQMATARNTRMAWFSEQIRLPLGSEDGSAVTARYLMFAHGAESWGFGWRDKEMRHDKTSPYYLGAWWPDAEPATFFRPAQLKPIYRTVVFDPRYRLPLYQAVFHDAVINTHHWTLDNLKFPEVIRTRNLLSQLYNTPPLFNVSRATLRERLPEIIKADAQFRPLHQVLWDKALIDFRWLDKEGWLQQTTFSDGSVLMANFSDQSVAGMAPHSLVVRLAGRPLPSR